MKENILKKITSPVEILHKISFGIVTTFLAIFLFGLFVPFNITLAAPRLTIEATKDIIDPKEYLVSANVFELVNKSVSFLSSPATGTLFKPSESCTTGGSGNPSSCYVKFSSTQAGTFKITAWTNYNGKLQSEKAIEIIIPKENTSSECKPPKALDWLNRCMDCPSPNIIVKGYCEKKLITTDCESLNRILNTVTNRCDCNSPKIVNDSGDCKNLNTVPLTNNNTTTNTNTTYTPLAPLPELGNQNCPIVNADGTIQKNADGTPKMGINNCIETDKTKVSCPFGNYLNIIIKLIIGIAAVLAMVMIVMGGIEYMTSEVVSGKEAGKETITHAILGLLLALGAYLILNTINPQLLSACLDKLPQATIVIDDSVPQTAINGMYCTKTAGTNGGYKAGDDWNKIAGAITQLPTGVVSNHPGQDCTKVGEQNCTSLRGLDISIITNIKNKCGNGCEIIVTAGTECWLHGGASQNTKHRPNSSTVDVRATSTSNTFFTGNTSFPNDNKTYNKGGVSCVAESANATSSTTGSHWHCQ